MYRIENGLGMTEAAKKAKKAIQIELLQNDKVGYQALIDISDESYMRLNDEFKTLWSFIETLGSISYRMNCLYEVCIECEGKESLKKWHDTINYWQKECQAELEEWNKTAEKSLVDA